MGLHHLIPIKTLPLPGGSPASLSTRSLSAGLRSLFWGGPEEALAKTFYRGFPQSFCIWFFGGTPGHARLENHEEDTANGKKEGERESRVGRTEDRERHRLIRDMEITKNGAYWDLEKALDTYRGQQKPPPQTWLLSQIFLSCSAPATCLPRHQTTPKETNTLFTS